MSHYFVALNIRDYCHVNSLLISVDFHHILKINAGELTLYRTANDCYHALKSPIIQYENWKMLLSAGSVGRKFLPGGRKAFFFTSLWLQVAMMGNFRNISSKLCLHACLLRIVGLSLRVPRSEGLLMNNFLTDAFLVKNQIVYDGLIRFTVRPRNIRFQDTRPEETRRWKD